MLFSIETSAQVNHAIRLPDYDEKWLHYGFRFGVHSNAYRLKYSDDFVRTSLDSTLGIFPVNKAGFSVGFVANFRVNDYVNFRILPGVNFSEYQLDYVYIGQDSRKEPVESTMIELPFQLKFKSQRRVNSRMYIVAGITPSVEANGRKKLDNEDRLITESFNITADFGFGIDIYNEWYKFSPEIRFSRGMSNMLKSEQNDFSAGIDRLTTNMVTLFLLFEGGK